LESLGNLTYGPTISTMGESSLSYTLTDTNMDFLMPLVSLDDPGGLLLYLITQYRFGATGDVAFWGFTGPGGYSAQVNPYASVVPLPAALPLFAAGLSIMGLLGWRRNRKPAAIPA
jgi:hypothetical protein